MLLQDVFLEKLAHFDREVIPEHLYMPKFPAHLVLLLSSMILANIPAQKSSLK